mmetsp:Transcript_36881/g.115938  ORF Transcript_36881/g.115938 Transcript_36881/m.115938 type:complete len:283 (-) Transcript_36881:317-1165(-)
MHHTPFALHDERAACVRFDFSPHLPRLFCAAHGQQRKLQNTLGRSFGTAAIRLCSRVSDSGRRSSSSKTRRPLRFPIGLARTAASPCTSAMAASRSASVYESRSRRVVGSRRGGGRTSRRSGGRGSGRFLLDLEVRLGIAQAALERTSRRSIGSLTTFISFPSKRRRWIVTNFASVWIVDNMCTGPLSKKEMHITLGSDSVTRTFSRSRGGFDFIASSALALIPCFDGCTHALGTPRFVRVVPSDSTFGIVISTRLPWSGPAGTSAWKSPPLAIPWTTSTEG